jgi:septal ring factor EnvC (AmiA/AmiB activator)
MKYVFLAILLLLAAPAQAQLEKAEAVRAELAEKKAQHAELKKKSLQISREVTGLKSKLINTSTHIRKSENALASIDQKLKKLRQEEVRHIENLYKDQAMLDGMMTAARRYQSSSTPQLLVQSKPLDAARASLIMKSVIPHLRAESDTVKAQLAELDKIEKKISAQLKAREKEYKKYNAQEKDLTKLLTQRSAVYKETESARKKQEAEVARLAREAKNIDDLLRKIKKRSTADKNTTLALPADMIAPVAGGIRTAFGQKDDMGATSRGITFEARPASSVVTPLAGKVVFAGPFQKYKQILIVEHKGGYHSLIAGLGRIDTVVGASLSAGEPVGTAAKPAASSDAALLYYELRRNGDPVDPRKTLAAKKGKNRT